MKKKLSHSVFILLLSLHELYVQVRLQSYRETRQILCSSAGKQKNKKEIHNFYETGQSKRDYISSIEKYK